MQPRLVLPLSSDSVSDCISFPSPFKESASDGPASLLFSEEFDLTSCLSLFSAESISVALFHRYSLRSLLHHVVLSNSLTWVWVALSRHQHLRVHVWIAREHNSSNPPHFVCVQIL